MIVAGVCSRVGETERLLCTMSCNALAVEVPHPLQGLYRRHFSGKAGQALIVPCNPVGLPRWMR